MNFRAISLGGLKKFVTNHGRKIIGWDEILEAAWRPQCHGHVVAGAETAP